MSSTTYLYVPSHRDRMVAKAVQGVPGADVVIFDLEDGVPAEQVEVGHDVLRRRLAERRDGSGHALLRVRGDREGFLDDLGTAGQLALDGVVIPKCDRPEVVADQVGAIVERLGPVAIWPLVETALGIEDMGAVLDAAADVAGSVGGVLLGSGDLRGDLGARRTPDQVELLYARSRFVSVARSRGVQAIIDSPEPGVAADEVLAHASDRARSLGMTGKCALHPAQLATIRSAFEPSEDELAWANEVLAAPDGGSVVDGSFVDAATRKRASDVLSRSHAQGPRNPDAGLGGIAP